MTDFNHLFLKHVAASFDKQLALGDIIGSQDWTFSMDTGLLGFGSQYRFKAQVIGSEATYDNTWLWGWANEASGIPANLLRAGQELRAFGQQNGIQQLTQPGFSINQELNGHILSMIASGLCNGSAYYRGPYDGGALFLLIRDENFPRSTVIPAVRISTIFPQLISAMPIPDHRTAFIAYLQYYGARLKEEPETITAKFDNGDLLQARFLKDNRLEDIRVKALPAQ